MIIKGIIDLDSGNFLNDQGTADMGAITIQAQETVTFMLRFQVNGVLLATHGDIDDMDIVFAAKPTDDYTGTDYYAYQDTWVKNETTVGYDADVNFYTSEIVTGIANTASLALNGQFKINDYPDTSDGITRFSQLTSMTVKNSVVSSAGTASPVLFPRLVSSGTAPAASNDASEGYDVGSVWVVTGTGNAAYILIDSTEDAAIWSEMTSETDSTAFNNLGIGLTAPSAPIHVRKVATDSNQRMEMMRLELVDEGVDMNIGHGPGIDFYVGQTSGSNYGGTIAVVKEQAADANDDAAMVFHTTTDEGVADNDKEKLRITSDGKIGIGTAVPSGAKLTVSGNSDVGASDVALRIEDLDTTTGSKRPKIEFYGGASLIGYWEALDSGTGNGMGWNTNSGLHFIIDTSGRVGINTNAPSSLCDIRGAAGAAGILTLSTAELTVVDGNELGRINFSAPLESSGTDAILVAASIYAEANATFAADNNETDLVFATGASETATEKMRLSSAGNLTVEGTGHLDLSSATASYRIQGGNALYMNHNGISLKSTGVCSWSSTANATATKDVLLYRDAAGILAQRNSTNTQEFRLYETWTDASNYERGTIKFDSNFMVIGTDDLGTGTASGLKLQTDSTDRVTITAGGLIGIGTAVPAATTDIHIHSTDSRNILLTNPTTGVALTDGTYIGVGSSVDFAIINQESGKISLGTSGTERLEIDSAGNTTFSGTIQTLVCAIGSLPSASPAGQRAFVNDSYYAYSYSIVGNIAYAGGSYPGPVYSDGTYWKMG